MACPNPRLDSDCKGASEPTVLVAASQTSFRKSLGQAWLAHSSSAAIIFERADRILGERLGMLPSAYIRAHFLDDLSCKSSMARTDVPQIAIYIVAIACWEGMKQFGLIRSEDIVAAIGLSFGEIVLLTIANSISFEQGLRFVVRRARIMQEVALANPGGLIVVCTTDEVILNKILNECRQDSVLNVLRVKNSTSLLTGSFAALGRVADMVKGMRIACFRPSDCAPFHSELMRAAVPRIEEALNELEFKQPQFPVISNATARPFEIRSVRKTLLDNICNRILWRESLDFILSDSACRSARWLVLEPAEVMARELSRIPVQINVRGYDIPPGGNTDKQTRYQMKETRSNETLILNTVKNRPLN